MAIIIGDHDAEPARAMGAEHERLLEQLVVEHAGTLGQRDRLPYTEAFDRLLESFNAGTGSSLNAHDLWRLIARLAK